MATLADGHAGYRVELCVNGIPVPGYTLQRTHREDVADRQTLSATAKLAIKHGDIVTVQVVSERNVNGQKLQYRVLADGSALVVERMAIF